MHESTVEEILKAQDNDNKALTNLINNNEGLVWSIVKRFIGRGYSKEELFQVGCIGLIKAIKRFDTGFDTQISTYAVPYIIGEIKRFIRDDNSIKISRSIKELAIKINYLKQEYLTKEGRELQISEISGILNVTKEEIAVAIDSMNPMISIDEETYNEEKGETKQSIISNNKDETNELINKITIKELIDTLDKRDKQIIVLRYYNQKTQTQVANILGITQVQVSRLEKKILENLRRRIEA